MKLLYASLLTCAAFLSGCAASGPNYNLDAVTLENGGQAYRVQCQGLLETGKACVDQANKVCGADNYHLISRAGPVDDAYKPDTPRELLFTCRSARTQPESNES
ncbi:hypothetical protein [Burkholderia sp. SCN-KJ]|uniref:hypothetical protein n=1 Tax=Burkholderia sp. SCN-KJ TaxID=2969248 RepID=UPI0021506653|nr:hypothetical protein [Burkholderia sp. SCN-KJ]MCR4471337.1 hypothetical protein [Burkholderia sp. SCN-KJ]